jgi:hypothetical protein
MKYRVPNEAMYRRSDSVNALGGTLASVGKLFQSGHTTVRPVSDDLPYSP